jgi:hypothetical protein
MTMTAELVALEVPDAVTGVDSEYEADLNRQIEFTRTLNAGDFLRADQMIADAEAAGRSGEHLAFTHERIGAEHRAVIATRDADIMDAFADHLDESGREAELARFWERRTQACEEALPTPNVRVQSVAMVAESDGSFVTNRRQAIAALANIGIRFTADAQGVMRLHVAQGSPAAAYVYRHGGVAGLTGVHQSVNYRFLDQPQAIVFGDSPNQPFWNITRLGIVNASKELRAQGGDLVYHEASDIVEKVEPAPAFFPRVLGSIVLR